MQGGGQEKGRCGRMKELGLTRAHRHIEPGPVLVVPTVGGDGVSNT
jgi:hypothetical protein